MTQPPQDEYFGNFDATAGETQGQPGKSPLQITKLSAGPGLDYQPITGTFVPPPPDRDTAIAGYNYSGSTGAQYKSAYDNYINENGGPSQFKPSSGDILRRVDDYDGDGNLVGTKYVPDDTATRLYQSMNAAKGDFETYSKMLSKGGIFYAAAAGSGSGSGGGSGRAIDPGDPARQEFEDFMNRAKGLYSLEDEEQGWSMKADDQNMANKKAAMSGAMNWNTTVQYPNQRPYNERLSDIVRPGVPSFLSPPYGSSGGGAFGGGLPDFTQGFAEGTGNLGDTPIDPEIEWMIGFNPFAANPGGPFDPKGKQLTGFRNTQGAR